MSDLNLNLNRSFHYIVLYGTITNPKIKLLIKHNIHTYLFAISAAARISLNSPAILATPKHPINNPMMH